MRNLLGIAMAITTIFIGCASPPPTVTQKPVVAAKNEPPQNTKPVKPPTNPPPAKPKIQDNKNSRAKIPPDFPIPIYNATENDWEIIRDTFADQAPELIRSIKNITIYADNSTHHFEGSHAAHTEPNGNVCFLRKFMTPSIIRHEAVHSLENKLSSEDIRKWINITGEDEYIQLAKLPDNAFPLLGIIIKRGADNYSEDMGEWVEAIVRCSQGLTHPFLKIQKADPRYREKLRFFRDHKAINNKEYEKILSYFH